MRSTLGVTPATAIGFELYRPRRFRAKKYRSAPVDFQDWMIDGIALRTIVSRASGHETQEMTLLCDEGARWAVPYLDRLQGRSAPDFDDGRVAVLVCPLDWDLGCEAVSAEISVTYTEVHWRRLGWQNNYDKFTPAFEPELNFSFPRESYDALLNAMRVKYSTMSPDLAGRPGEPHERPQLNSDQ